VRVRSFTAVSDDVPTPQFVQQTLAVAPGYAPIFKVYPAPNQPYAPTAQVGRFIGSGSLKQDDLNAVARIDWYITASICSWRATRVRVR